MLSDPVTKSGSLPSVLTIVNVSFVPDVLLIPVIVYVPLFSGLAELVIVIVPPTR